MPIDFQAELKQVIDSHAAMYQAAVKEGVKIGRREMRLELYPLIRELCDELDNVLGYVPDESGMDVPGRLLILLADELLDETAQPIVREDAPSDTNAYLSARKKGEIGNG